MQLQSKLRCQCSEKLFHSCFVTALKFLLILIYSSIFCSWLPCSKQNVEWQLMQIAGVKISERVNRGNCKIHHTSSISPPCHYLQYWLVSGSYIYYVLTGDPTPYHAVILWGSYMIAVSTSILHAIFVCLEKEVCGEHLQFTPFTTFINQETDLIVHL